MNQPSPLQALLTALPFASGGLYALGLAFYAGYLGAFGIDDSLFQLSIDRILMYGFLALTLASYPEALYGVAAFGSLVLSTALAVSMLSKSRLNLAASRLLLRIRGLARDAPKATATLLESGGNIYTQLMLGSFALVAAVLMSSLALKHGRAQAAGEILQFASGEGKFAMLSVDAQQLPVRVKLVTCGERHCAYWNGNESLIVRHDSVHRLSLTPSPAAQSASASTVSRQASAAASQP